MDLKFQNKKENYNLFSDDCDNDSFQISKTLYQANKDSPIKETLNEVLLDQKSPLQFLRGIEMTNFAKEKLHLKQTLPYEKTNSPSPLPENDLSISSIQGSLLIIFTYILTDIRKKPHSFKIGVFSIFIVVAFLIVLETAKLLTPALFIRLSEGEIGDGDLTIRSVALENDTRLTNESYFSNPFHEFRMLNGLNIEKICDLLEEVEGCSARWMLIGKTKHFNYSIQTFIIIIDSQKEKSIGLGRNSKANVEKLGNNECFLTESTMRSLNINDNYVDLNIDVLNSLISQESLVIAESRNSKAGNLKSNEEKVLNLKKQFKIILNESLQNIFENLNNSTSNLSILDDILKETNLELYSNLFSGLGFGEINKNNISSFINSNKGKVLEILDISFDSIIDTLNLTMKLKVKDSIKSPKGKWPSVMGNVIVLDYHYISQILIKKFVSNFKKRIEDKIGFLASLVSDEEIEKIILERSNDFDLKQFAMFEYLTFKNKLEIYADEKTIDIKLVEFSNKLSKLLGKNYITQTDVALSGVIKKMSIIKSFLDNVFGSSVILLIMLSILLIYSLMVSNVDEKTFEFGMLRALGFNKTHMLSLLFIQALVFAFLGMFLAFLFSFILNAMICYIIYDYSLLAASYIPSEMSLILGFSIGLIMPIISNVFPILRALSKTLRDSLDLFHREINIFRVRVMKLEKLGVSLYQSLNAVVLITVGFSSYYLAPKAFIMQDIPMFLWIMNLILIIFLLGLTAFLNLFELFFEKLILKLILFLLFTDRKLESIIQKNIKGHRSRNLKTTLMFSITMSFLIFAGTGFQLQETAINDTFRLHIGSDMTAEIPPNSKIFLDEYALRQFLESYKLKYPNQIESYSFSSIPFDQMPKVHFPALSPLSFYPRRRVSIKAVEDNFLKSVYSHYFTPVQYDETLIYDTLEDGKRDSVFALSSSKNIEYFSIMKDLHHITSNNEMRTINKTEEKMRILQFLLPEGNRNYFGVEPNIPAIILMGNLKYPSKITTMIAKMPGFGMFFSSYMTASKMVITSMENFKFLMEKEWDGLSIYEKETIKDFYERNPKNMTYDIPKEKIFIKFARPLQETERSELANGLRNQFKNMITVLFDTADFIRDIHEAFFYLDIFYYVVALISIILSFFLILVSFSSNVKEHVWEFGVLRSLGLNKTQMTRIYIYEALCLTIASGLIGTAVGVIVALILTMQYLTFAEIPMVFQFPWSMFLITFFSGIFTSISGSYLALKEIREKPISAIIKGLN